ncbi:CDP-glycerol:glycerophosphate glycerophosphotransferase, partial [Streptomyces sp. gb1(2016)]
PRAETAPDGGLRIGGTGAGALLELRHSTLGETVAVPLPVPVAGQGPSPPSEGRFTAVLAPPPREGDWEVFLDDRPVRVGAALAALLPVHAPGTRFHLDRRHGDRLTVHCAPALDDAERSAYHQRLLRTAHHPAQKRLPLRDAVLYAGDAGGTAAGSLRAVHAELVRRSTDAEHLWVTDGTPGAATRVPATAVPVVAYSSAWYEALARARRIVAAGQ